MKKTNHSTLVHTKSLLREEVQIINHVIIIIVYRVES
jgi:hypothetical protein